MIFCLNCKKQLPEIMERYNETFCSMDCASAAYYALETNAEEEREALLHDLHLKRERCNHLNADIRKLKAELTEARAIIAAFQQRSF